MNYTKKSFTVAGPGTKQYDENWERTFRGKAHPDDVEVSIPRCPTCDQYKHRSGVGAFCSNTFHLPDL